MVTLRFGLQKHKIKIRNEDIINNEQYKQANERDLQNNVGFVKERGLW